MKETAVILARVSSKEQVEGYSLDSQAKLLQEYCVSNKLKVVDTYRLAETASKHEQRKVFHDLLKRIEKESINHLVVEKVDRLTRNQKDAIAIDEWVHANETRKVHFVKNGLVIHKESRSGDIMVWDTFVNLAKFTTNNLREEAMKGWAEKLAQGWLPCSIPPHGYMTVTREGKRIHIHNPDTIRIVKRLLLAYLEPNHSIATITELADELGLRSYFGRRLGKEQIRKLLMNPFYYGVNAWNGKLYPGAQKPIITKETYDQIQQKLSGKTPPRFKKHNPLFKTMVKCGCGHLIIWEHQKGRWYGRCQHCRKKCLREDRYDQLLMETFDKLMCPSDKLVKWVQAQLLAKHQKDKQLHESALKQLQESLDRVRKQQHILYDDRLAGRITTERYDDLSKSFEAKESDLKVRIDQIDDITHEGFEEGIKIFKISQEAAKTYSKKSVEAKRIIISKLFSNLGWDGSSPLLKLNELAEWIADRSEQTRGLIKALELGNYNDNNRGRDELRKELKDLWKPLAGEIGRYSNLKEVLV